MNESDEKYPNPYNDFEPSEEQRIRFFDRSSAEPYEDKPDEDGKYDPPVIGPRQVTQDIDQPKHLPPKWSIDDLPQGLEPQTIRKQTGRRFDQRFTAQSFKYFSTGTFEGEGRGANRRRSGEACSFYKQYLKFNE